MYERVFRIALLLAAGLSASSCVQTTLPAVPWQKLVAKCPDGSSTMALAGDEKLFFVSTRLPDCNDGIRLTDYRTDRVRYGRAAVGEDRRVDLDLVPYDSWKSDLIGQSSRGVVIYIHGYRTSPEAALIRARGIQKRIAAIAR